MNIPAETTGPSGSLSREARKDIKKGVKWKALMAFRALLDVSLRMLKGRVMIYVEVGLTRDTRVQ